jgi:hypothetical protein
MSTELDRGRFDGLVRQAMASVANGKTTLADVVASLAAGSVPQAPEPQPVSPVKLGEGALIALRKLPDFFGKIAPTTARKLTIPERHALARERELIDEVLKPLKDRKDIGIREIVSNDLDRIAEAEKLVDEDTPLDARGHYAVKHSVSAPGTGKRFERRVCEPKVTISGEGIQRAYERGDISREQYLALTSVPEVPRQFDPEKARKAIVKDPTLLLVIAEHAATMSTPTTSVYLTDDKSQ